MATVRGIDLEKCDYDLRMMNCTEARETPERGLTMDRAGHATCRRLFQRAARGLGDGLFCTDATVRP